MKMKIAGALLATFSATASVPAWANVTAGELVGTWRSPQTVDTYLIITQTPKGLVMSEVHQNFHGADRVESEDIKIDKDRVDVGTWYFRYDETTKMLVTLIVPAHQVVAFARVQ